MTVINPEAIGDADQNPIVDLSGHPELIAAVQANAQLIAPTQAQIERSRSADEFAARYPGSDTHLDDLSEYDDRTPPTRRQLREWRDAAIERALLAADDELERLRALLAEALNGWEPNARSHCTNGDRPGCTYEACDCVYDIARIRREAGLS